mmetsp:Transcript_7976/g.12067  ORF Transcript_7976/g.12067 Transcript_7976/m.12067 type:complete len:302 (-) Transcript_7976:166-1071(-)|eukprot:CAMPEP_0201537946 /NCGR_PEP_ID=MMETSP0161_2-20130828/66206_1 /ASSEMBLY_ACC=CAM_ASM_000251 /TAXON_ID=180227 /ORGANISM="Neoparamoeba aestuarina, Strain SoJaBio B1-5/56/2" /LENGTH=301 /DNA_ID=CAMNT_0047944525 /DNA_START=114 /DNA_END=1019 /DNA_ORIENTATION=-
MAAEGDLLSQAQYFAASLDFEKAVGLYRQAINEGGLQDNADVLEDFALVLLEVGEFQEAINLLQRCITLSPNQGHTKYMTLGQLANGKQSLAYFEKGISLILRLTNNKNKDEELSAQLASAYVSAAEIFMTDCCFENDAEQRAEKFISLALKANPQGAEPLQALANLRICQQRPEDALTALQQSFSLWKDAQLGELPPFDFRKSTVKLFMELHQNETAIEVIDTLLREDDDVFDVWYLRGLCAFHLKDKEVCLSDLKTAMTLFDKHNLKGDPNFEEVVVHIRQLVAEANQFADEDADDMAD